MPAEAFPHAALHEDGDELGDTGAGVRGELCFDLSRDHGEIPALTEPHAQRSHDRLDARRRRRRLARPRHLISQSARESGIPCRAVATRRPQGLPRALLATGAAENPSACCKATPVAHSSAMAHSSCSNPLWEFHRSAAIRIRHASRALHPTVKCRARCAAWVPMPPSMLPAKQLAAGLVLGAGGR